VFLLRDDELVEAPRLVSDPADLNGLLDELTAPLTPAETAQGLRACGSGELSLRTAR
jgi:hypothetical protein